MEQLYYQGNLFSSLGRKKHTFLPNFREEKFIFGIGRRKNSYLYYKGGKGIISSRELFDARREAEGIKI